MYARWAIKRLNNRPRCIHIFGTFFPYIQTLLTMPYQKYTCRNPVQNMQKHRSQTVSNLSPVYKIFHESRVSISLTTKRMIFHSQLLDSQRACLKYSAHTSSKIAEKHIISPMHKIFNSPSQTCRQILFYYQIQQPILFTFRAQQASVYR